MWKIWRTPTRCSQIVWLTVHRFLFNDNSMDDNETRKLTESADPTRSWKSRFGRLLRIVLAVTLIVSVLLIFLLLVVVVWLHLTHGEVRMSHMLSAAMFNVIDQSKPTIVTWTEFFGLSLLPAFQPTSKCPYDCLFVDRNHLYANQSTVRLFHARDFSVFDLPPFDPNALNVYFSHESPVNSEFRYHLLTESALRRDFFNLTITYQMSSDVFYPYDIFERIDGTENPDNVYTDEDVERAIDLKTELALVANSNCRTDSHREDLIRELRNLIPVTTVGKCYDLQCDSQCFESLQRQHHFYLAFENSVCPDYLTEKFWRMRELIVPIVLSRLAVPENIPSYTYIAVDDFTTIQEFVDYLYKVVKNRELYKSYFAWTKHYRRTGRTREVLDPGCQLCKMAVEKQRHQLPDIRKYLSHNQCKHAYGSYLLTDRRVIK